MATSTHPGHGSHRSAAVLTLRALHILRHMAPLRAVDDNTAPALRVNWGVVITNAVGAALGLLLTSSAAGLAYLVWRLPAQQDQVLRNQEAAKVTLIDLIAEVKRLDANDRRIDSNDRVQDTRLEQLEGRR